VDAIFPKEREILKEELSNKSPGFSRELKKEILTLYKLGLEEYEIRYLLSLKEKQEARLNWEN